jgi:hypothetical protein
MAEDRVALAAPTLKSSTSVNGVSARPKAESEVGVGLFLPFVTPYRNAWEVYRDDEVTPAQLLAMRRTDGQARALYRLIVLPIRAALSTCTFVPPAGIEGGTEEATFVENLFTLPESGGGMMTPWSLVMSQALMAVFDGFSGFELVYWSPDKGPLQGKWTLKKIAYRPTATLTFLLNKDGDFYGFRQRTFHMGRSIDVEIAPQAAVYHACNEEERKFYGQSYFEAAFYHWDKKVRLYFVAHLAAQRAATGTRVGHLPPSPTPDERESFKNALSDLGFAQWLAVPDGYSVDLLKEGTQFDFLSFINHHNSQMSKSILAPFFDDQQGGGGDTTLVDFGKQSDAMFILMLDTIMAEVESFINDKIIPRFIDWNFDSGKYPKFRFGQLTAEQKGILTDMFKTLAVVSNEFQSCTPEFMHELEKQVAEQLGLEIDYESVEQRLADSAKLAEAQAAVAPALAPGVPGEPASVDPAQPTPRAGPVRQSRSTGRPQGGAGVGHGVRTVAGGGTVRYSQTGPDEQHAVALSGLARELLLDAAGPPVVVRSLAELDALLSAGD